MPSKYKKIKGVNYDRGLIELADSLLTAQGESILLMNDAKKIITLVYDKRTFTEVELKTLKYIKDNYNINIDAKKYLNAEIEKLLQEQKSGKIISGKTPDETKKSSISSVKKKSPGSERTKPRPESADQHEQMSEKEGISEKINNQQILDVKYPEKASSETIFVEKKKTSPFLK